MQQLAEANLEAKAAEADMSAAAKKLCDLAADEGDNQQLLKRLVNVSRGRESSKKHSSKSESFELLSKQQQAAVQSRSSLHNVAQSNTVTTLRARHAAHSYYPLAAAT